jgi:tetratricopeptide (TPR) repeat protein
MLVQVLTAKGAYQEAFDEVEGAQAAFPTASEGFLEQRGFLLGRLGRKEEALQLLNDTVQTNPGLRRALNLEFNVHLGLRDYDQAIAALEKIAQEGYFEAKEARATPWFKEMENHPRFQALCKKYEKRG